VRVEVRPVTAHSDPLGQARVGQRREHLLGAAEHARPLPVRQRVHTVELRGDQLVAGVAAQDPDGLVVSRTRRPDQALRDRPLVQARREEEATQQSAGGRGEVGVLLRVGPLRERGEVLGETLCASLVDDVGQRVPPPRGRFERDLLRVEHPHPT
jgi:hypothetical protein